MPSRAGPQYQAENLVRDWGIVSCVSAYSGSTKRVKGSAVMPMLQDGKLTMAKAQHDRLVVERS
jgi:hypothetical protein